MSAMRSRVVLHLGGRLVAGAQGHMPGRAALGGVDLVAGAHGRLTRRQITAARQGAQQADGLSHYALLGIVEQQAVQFQVETIEALRIVREQRP